MKVFFHSTAHKEYSWYKKSEIRQIDGRFLGSIQMRWNKSAALIDSNWRKKRRAGRGGQMSQRSLGQARFSDQWQKQILPSTMTKIKERWSDHGSLNKWWFSCPSAWVRYILAGSFVKQSYLFVQIPISLLKQSLLIFMSWLNLLANVLRAGAPNLSIHLRNIICKLWQVLGNFGFGISQQDLKYVQFSEQIHSSNCSSFDVRFVRVSFLDWPIFHNFNRSNRSKCRRSLLVAFYWIARGQVGKFWINCHLKK